ncbi:DUF1178 family protein [Acetobacter suratthaniensis]|uniref:DUF1178 family protein n=1 Tax=Acetobacter suratthaniensis TaxID=1502841 RepID=A0ABS3LIG5_9PROT|nr:DUF1178 family protein [Acetobacter suratthaniensis]MBO1327398.1 DUF1178 family protein [Acetobacter suratthaniensis]MCX2564989.1 DUF1178 family protein [Acetobacter suratthaniensis]
MICYRLRCADGHLFEGWYRDSATFSRLRAAGMLSCTECGTADVDQAPMAPAIVSGGRRRHEPAPQSHDGADTVVESGVPEPDTLPARQGERAPVSLSEAEKVMGAMRQMREMVEKNCENVGEHFAREALRIHHGEAPERGIYGDVSARDREMLHDEGVEFHAIPWVSKTDS